MLYEQRPPTEPEALEPTGTLWVPELQNLHAPKGAREYVARIRGSDPPTWRVVVRSGDRYAVVDELDSGFAVLVTSSWPAVDNHGALVFGDDGEQEEGHNAADLRLQIDEWRVQFGQTPRPLRIGDAFLVRGDWSRGVVDISAPARESAKMALFGACAGPIPGPPDSRDLADAVDSPLDVPAPTQQRPPGPTAAPAI